MSEDSYWLLQSHGPPFELHHKLRLATHTSTVFTSIPNPSIVPVWSLYQLEASSPAVSKTAPPHFVHLPLAGSQQYGGAPTTRKSPLTVATLRHILDGI